MMEQGSLADLLTLAKSGDDNKLGEMMAMMNGGMGGQQWMWWILIILFAFGGFGNGMFGRNMAPNGLDNANQLILEKLNGMSVEQCGQFSRVGNGICDSTYAITNAVRDARDAASACCCETNLNIERASNANQRATDALSHQLSDCCYQTQLRMQDLLLVFGNRLRLISSRTSRNSATSRPAWPPTIVKRLLPFRLIRRRSLVT